MQNWLPDPAVVAVGETGLDYFRSEGDLEWQRDRFQHHIRAAKLAGQAADHSQSGCPGKTRYGYCRKSGPKTVGGVMHCFVDDLATAEAAMAMGFYISYSGIVTFRNAGEVQATARGIPLERLLVETDAPYLAPMPYRGKPNQPAYVRHTAEFLAELRNETYEELARRDYGQFFRLFRDATLVTDV
ncbi:MAG: TatD family hydrolase [Gammaproteobacteria bacterium]|nr:TatD family hydrolase [Gammaproteobacteria bacterium]